MNRNQWTRKHKSNRKINGKINGSFLEISKTDKPSQTDQEKRKETRSISIKNERGEIMTEPTDTRRIREYYEQILRNKFNNR